MGEVPVGLVSHGEDMEPDCEPRRRPGAFDLAGVAAVGETDEPSTGSGRASLRRPSRRPTVGGGAIDAFAPRPCPDGALGWAVIVRRAWAAGRGAVDA